MPTKKKKPFSQKHKNLLRRKRDNNSTYWRNKADLEWSKCIHLLLPRCVICDKPHVQAHHLITRMVGSLRHRLENGVCLCPGHHTLSEKLSAHKAPMEFVMWMEEHRPDQMAWVKAHRHHVGTYDYKTRYEELQDIKAHLAAGAGGIWNNGELDMINEADMPMDMPFFDRLDAIDAVLHESAQER